MFLFLCFLLRTLFSVLSVKLFLFVHYFIKLIVVCPLTKLFRLFYWYRRIVFEFWIIFELTRGLKRVKSATSARVRINLNFRKSFVEKKTPSKSSEHHTIFRRFPLLIKEQYEFHCNKTNFGQIWVKWCHI